MSSNMFLISRNNAFGRIRFTKNNKRLKKVF
jgi:hypothetical protein